MNANHKLLTVALSAYGVEEYTGKESNPIIDGWIAQIGFNGVVTDDDGWCALFMCWVAKCCGAENIYNLSARAWIGAGEEVKQPTQGDVVVFWRNSIDSWTGHVGLFVADTQDDIYVLGGNQDNKVCIKAYPKDRVLGYRRLHCA